jgi:hypothetical protein
MPGPSLQDMVNYSVNRAGQWERIKQGLYDTNLYPTAGQTQLNFFSAPVGFGTSVQQGNAASTKSIQDTNMTLAGQIPASQNVLIETIEVNVLPGSSAAAATFAMVNPVAFNAAASAGTVFAAASDAAAIYNSGALLLNVGSKNYLTEAPLSKFPPQTHLDVNAAVGNTSATTGQTIVQLTRAEGRPYHIDPVRLETGQNFSVQLVWPVAVATPSGFNAQVRVTLDGYLFRASQ